MAESTTIVGMELICRAVLSDRLNVDETKFSFDVGVFLIS